MYQLEIKQIVDYPRCRIYRNFIRQLTEDKNIRTKGTSNLYHYLVLCSYANFRTSHKYFEGMSYIVYPGEWICKLSELTKDFRCRFQHQTVKILEHLQKSGYITFSKLGRGNLIKFMVTKWTDFNRVLEYNAPCQKDIGFFFFPIETVNELIGNEKCSEMDMILDLWINTIYNDEQVEGSDVGPVVYFRNGTGNPFVSYAELAKRWSLSKSTVGRILRKFQEMNYLTLLSFPGRYGSVIYLNNYLSVMFDMSDSPIDKAEVAMSLRLDLDVPEASEPVCDELPKIVPSQTISVPNEYIDLACEKVVKLLAEHGILCCSCSQSIYKLLELSDCKAVYFQYLLTISCPVKGTQYKFLLRLERLPEAPEYRQVSAKEVSEYEEE